MSDTKACPFCGEEIKAIAKKCKHCGTWLNEEQKEPIEKKQIECPACAESIDEDAKVCPYCKQEIKNQLDNAAAEKAANLFKKATGFFKFEEPARFITGLLSVIIIFASRNLPLFYITTSQRFLGFGGKDSLSLSMNNISNAAYIPDGYIGALWIVDCLGWLLILISLATLFFIFIQKYSKVYYAFFASCGAYAGVLIYTIITALMLYAKSAGESSSYGSFSITMLPGLGWIVVLIGLALLFITASKSLSKIANSFFSLVTKSVSNAMKDIMKEA